MSEVYTKAQSDAQATVIGNRINTRTSAAHIVSEIAAANDQNLVSDAQLASISNIPDDHFKGTFTSLAAIPTAGAVSGDYALLAVTDGDDTQAIWDDDAGAWIDTGAAATGETAGSIKTKYESNPNTNAFTDAEKTKLAGITDAADISDFTAALDAALA